MMVHKDSISEDQRNAEAYLSARRELSLHGEQIFDKYTNILESIFDLPQFANTRSFFIKKHLLSYKDTFEWVVGPDSFDNGDIENTFMSFIED